MSEETMVNESGSDVATLEGHDGGSGNYDIQDRMSDGIDDDYWYSSSEGAVVDKDGELLINEKTGQPFKSMDELKAFADSQKNAENPKTQNAQPQNKAQQAEKPMAKSFESYMFKNGQPDPETLYKQSQFSEQFKYNDEFIPRIDQQVQAQEQNQPKLTPIQEVESQRETLVNELVNPILSIRDSLVESGLSVEQANAAVSKTYHDQMAKIDQIYKEQQQNALQKMIEEKTNPVTAQAEQKELKAKSEANITNLSNQYFPGGKDAFFALINGYNDEKGNFVKGPASAILDFIVKVSAGDKKFGNHDEISKHYVDTFTKITADPAMAKMLIDMANRYYLGGNIKHIHDAGKKIGISETKKAYKTFKTRPSSYQHSQPSSDDEEKLPEMLRNLGLR